MSRTSSPTLYLMCADVTDFAWFLDWMARRHCPDVMGLGYYSARAYKALSGRQMLWDVYEIPDTGVFDTVAYGEIGPRDPDTPKVMSLFTNRSVTLYDQVIVLCGGQAATSPAPLSSKVISGLRFDCSHESFDHLSQDITDRFSELPIGCLTLRLCRRRERQHPKWPSTEPEYLLYFEWQNTELASAFNAEGLISTSSGQIYNSDYSILSREYGIMREDVWD